MKARDIPSFMTSLILVVATGCGQSAPQPEKQVIAVQGDYKITREYVALFARLQEPNRSEPFTAAELEEYEYLLLEDFEADPALVLQLLAEVESAPTPQNPIGYTGPESPAEKAAREGPSGSPRGSSVPGGFMEFRNALGQMDPAYFENEQASALRRFLMDSQIRYESVESYGGAMVGGGGNYAEGILFCADGSFRFQSRSSASIGGDDFGGYSRDDIDFQGVWDTFTDRGTLFIGLYSQDPQLLRINPRGFLPMLVRSYNAQTLVVAGESDPKFYRRLANSCR